MDDLILTFVSFGLILSGWAGFWWVVYISDQLNPEEEEGEHGDS